MPRPEDFDPEEEGTIYRIFSRLRREVEGVSVDLIAGVSFRIQREEEAHQRLGSPEPLEVLADQLAQVIETIVRLVRVSDRDDSEDQDE